MGILSIISAIAASRRIKSTHKRKEEKKEESKPDHTGFVPYTKGWKEKHMEWVEAGLCGSCGNPSGEEKGICDECRWS